MPEQHMNNIMMSNKTSSLDDRSMKPMITYRFDQKASKILVELHECIQDLSSFLRSHDVEAGLLEELKTLVQGQCYIAALKAAQLHTQRLTSDRVEAVNLLVRAWQQLSLHSEVQYRMACKGLQQMRGLRVDYEEMKQEASLQNELGEQCASSRKGLFLIQALQRRLTSGRASEGVPRSLRASSA